MKTLIAELEKRLVDAEAKMRVALERYGAASAKEFTFQLSPHTAELHDNLLEAHRDYDALCRVIAMLEKTSTQP